MKTLIFALLTFALIQFAHGQSIGIGTSSPNQSAMLDVNSTTRGLLAPRMTTAQRTAIASPAKGLLVYDTDLNSLFHYNGAGWAAVGGGGGFTLPFDQTVNLNTSAFKITNGGVGPAIQAVTTNEFGYALQASNTTNYGYSVFAYSRSPNGIGVYALGDSSIAVKGESGKGIGIDAISTDSTALRARIIKGTNADAVILATHAGGGIAVDASSNAGSAIRAISSNTTASIIGTNNNASAGNGVYGTALSAGGAGVRGESTAGTGVLGYSNNNTGVSAGTLGGTALSASSVSGTALKGSSSSGYGLDVSGKIKISGGNTNPAAGAVLTSIDLSGNAVWKQPDRVAFRATGVYSGLNVIPDFTTRKLHFASEQYDYANSFQVTTDVNPTTDMSNFVAPVTGLYHFEVALSMQLANTSDDFTSLAATLKINRGGNIINLARSQTACCEPQGFGITITLSTDFRLLAGDDVYVEIRQSNDAQVNATIDNTFFDTYFSGRLILAD